MDSPSNHPQAIGTTRGVAVLVLKVIFLGTPFDKNEYELNCDYCGGLESTIRRFQNSVDIEVDGNFGQGTRKEFFRHFGINLEDVPHTLLRMQDTALQPNGELVMWPPSSGILMIHNSRQMTSGQQYRLLPSYLDWTGAHENPIGPTMGPSVFMVKCLFAGTASYQGYPLNTTFCNGLARTIAHFQASCGLEVDSCFGQGSRAAFAARYGRNLEEVPRQYLTEADTAIQPDGHVIAWPPAIVLS